MTQRFALPQSESNPIVRAACVAPALKTQHIIRSSTCNRRSCTDTTCSSNGHYEPFRPGEYALVVIKRQEFSCAEFNGCCYMENGHGSIPVCVRVKFTQALCRAVYLWPRCGEDDNSSMDHVRLQIDEHFCSFMLGEALVRIMTAKANLKPDRLSEQGGHFEWPWHCLKIRSRFG